MPHGVPARWPLVACAQVRRRRPSCAGGSLRSPRCDAVRESRGHEDPAARRRLARVAARPCAMRWRWCRQGLSAELRARQRAGAGRRCTRW
ncbi:MAG: hypothetical protein MZW92_73240 [Comamonadaceae bacterium]|nr:hypothetical protein [Comamonadaceae bacterium]